MTFYQELQLNQSGSKKIIRQSEGLKSKAHHTCIYIAKIAITVSFCFVFVTACSMMMGNENSVVGVVLLLHLMVFRNAHFNVSTKTSLKLLALFFTIMAVCPHAANQLGPAPGLMINLISLAAIVLLGCHNPLMSNQSTIVLSYLLLYGYDVTGSNYQMRVLGLAAGCLLTMLVFYRNNKNGCCKDNLKIVLANALQDKNRRKWLLSLILCVPVVIFISEICHMPRAMWAGIAAMSAIVPLMDNIKLRTRDRIIGNIAGGICFLILYMLLPDSIYAYIGILGGIGVGFSAKYGWQAVFNTFGALAIAEKSFGLTGAIHLRIIQNAFGVIFALTFCGLMYFVMERIQINKKNSRRS